jgi:hypothetical protein
MPLPVERWNRKLHYYVGLYLLLFVVLFAFSGLLLNHHWSESEFWAKRKETETVVPVRRGEHPADLVRRLGLAGDLEVMKDTGDGLEFQVGRPGAFARVQANFATGEAKVRRVQMNGWGVLHTIHTASGVRRGNPDLKRNWLPIRIWSFYMDAVAVGLVFMVLSSYWMWFRQRSKRLPGWISLAGGFLVCGFFLAGLSWLFPAM